MQAHVSTVIVAFGAAGENHHACAKQHGKNAHEFGVGDDVAQPPGQIVDTIQITKGAGVTIGCKGHGERLNVHDQDAQQGKAPENVQ